MAFGAGTAAKLFITNSANLDTDASPYITKIDFKMPVDEIEVTTLGSTERQYLLGFKSADMDVEGIWDPTIDVVLFAQRGGTAAPIRYSPQGTATGKIYYSGTGLLKDYQPPVDVDAAVTFKASWRWTNGVTRGTH